MNKNIQKILKEIKNDKGEYLNKLIDLCVISPKTIEEALKNSKNSEIIYNAAKYISDIDKITLTDELVRLNDIEYLYLYARDIKPTINIQRAILNSNNSKYIFNTARDVIGFNVESYENKIIELKNNRYIYMYALDVPNANVNKLAKALMETGKIDYVTFFAGSVKDAPIEELTDYVIKFNDPMEMLWFLKAVKKADRKKLINAILETKNKKVIKALIEVLTVEELKELQDKLTDYIKHKKLSNNVKKNTELLYEAVEKNDFNFIDENKEYFKELFKGEKNPVRTRHKKD